MATPADRRTEADFKSVAHAKAIIKNNRERYNRESNAAAFLCETLGKLIKEKKPITGTLQNISDLNTKLDNIAKRITVGYNYINDSEEIQTEESMAALHIEEHEFNKLYRDDIRVINDAKAMAKGNPGGQQGGQQGQQGTLPNLRPYEALKPKELNVKTSAEGLNQFFETYDSYRKTGKFDLYDEDVQLQLLKGCMGEDIVAKFDQVKREHNQIANNYEGWTEVIDLVYQEINPIFNRRWEMTKFNQDTNVPWTVWYEKMRKKFWDAKLNVESVTTDELLCLWAVALTKDLVLREKFFEITEPSEKKLLEKARAYEASQLGKQALSQNKEEHKCFETKARRNRSKSQYREDNRCFRCNIPGHCYYECEKNREKLHCKNCGKKGHATGAKWCRKAKTREESPSPVRGRTRDKRKHALKRADSKDKYPSSSEASETDDDTTTEKQEHQSRRTMTIERQRISKMAAKPIEKHKLCYQRVDRKNKSDVPTTTPTPLLPCQMFEKPSEKTWKEFDCCPDSGSTKAVVALNLVLEQGWKIRKNKELLLQDAKGENMKVEGTVKLFMRPKMVGGKPNKHGNTVRIEAIVSSSLQDEIFLGWQDLINLGVLPKNFPEVDAEVHKLNQTKQSDPIDLIAKKILERNKDVFKEEMDENTKMKGKMTIHLKVPLKDIKNPKRVTSVRKTPLGMQKAATKLTNKLIKAGVIKRVYRAPKFVAPAHFVLKPDGTVRLVTDYSGDNGLNAYIQRVVHGFPSAADIRDRLDPDSDVFCVMDLLSGYFQVELDEESSLLTTFLLPTEQGSALFAYSRAPMGLNSSGDAFCDETDSAFEGLAGTDKLVDDVLIQAKGTQQLEERVQAVLDRARDKGLTFSAKKLQIGRKVKFGGFILDATSGETLVTPNPDLLQAIKEIPPPKNVPELRRVLGMMNQLTSWNPDLSQSTKKMRQLLKKNVQWHFDGDILEEFETAKRNVTDTSALKPFDPNLQTFLATDASKLNGIGYALIQKEPEGKFRIIKCGSCSLTDTQSRYSATEVEMLGVQYSILKCKQYLQGTPFTLWSDHQPLKSILAKPIWEVANNRLARMREKLMEYRFNFEYVEGKKHYVADALSRSPLWEKMEPELDGTQDLSAHRINVMVGQINKKGVRKDLNLESLFKAAEDPNYQLVVDAVRTGTKLKDLPVNHPAREYKDVINRLSLIDSNTCPILLMDDTRLVIPKSMRQELLKKLHFSHCGISKTTDTAVSLYHWPGMAANIKDMVTNCDVCRELLPSKPHTAMLTDEFHFEDIDVMDHVGIDLFKLNGHPHLVLVDRFSSYPMYKKLKGEGFDQVTKTLINWFQTFGRPKEIRSDDGPAFRQIFTDWCSANNIYHQSSSASNARSNGSSESGCARIKKVLKKAAMAGQNIDETVSAFRNMSMSNGLSPSELFFRRRIRGNLPALQLTVNKSQHDAVREKQKQRYLDRDKTKAPATQKYEIGQAVWLQDLITKKWDRPGRIAGIRIPDGNSLGNGEGVSYLVNIVDNRKHRRRNQKFLMPRNEDDDDEPLVDNDNNPNASSGTPTNDVAPQQDQPLRRSARQAAAGYAHKVVGKFQTRKTNPKDKKGVKFATQMRIYHIDDTAEEGEDIIT